jgi:hypothetical protein
MSEAFATKKSLRRAAGTPSTENFNPKRMATAQAKPNANLRRTG